jgi:uncharacterized protein
MVEVSTLERWFEQGPGALIAFSGGVDSSLVAYLAKHFLGADRAVAVISASPSLKLSDLDAGKQFARSIGLQLKVQTIIIILRTVVTSASILSMMHLKT